MLAGATRNQHRIAVEVDNLIVSACFLPSVDYQLDRCGTVCSCLRS